MQFINMFLAAGVETLSKSASDVLVFRESAKKDIWIVVWLISALAVLFIAGLDSINDYLIHMAVIFSFILIALAVVSKEKIIEIDRAAGTIKKTSHLFSRSNDRIYRIADFSGVIMAEKPVEVGDGNLCILYSLVLAGNDRSLEIFSSGDRNTAEKYKNDIALFLGFPLCG